MLRMKIKISDLVNKVINREEMPKEVLFNGNIYKWCNDIGDYRKDGWGSCLMIRDIFDNFDRYGSFYNMLFEDVEIIEEPKKIEQLDVALLGQCDNWLRCPTNKVTKQDVELNPYIIDNIRENTLYFQRKINELIDAVNELKRDK